MTTIRRIWVNRWSFLRLAAALTLLVALVRDNPSRLARLQFEKLPAANYVSEARKLADVGRFGESLIVIDAGLSDEQVSNRYAILEEKERIEGERDSVIRKLRQFAGGAIFGSGDSMEALAGTISADLFVVGDIRDLLIEATKGVTGEGADNLIVLLSTVGIVTTVVPQFDVAASFLKVAKKAGALSKRLIESLVVLLRKAISIRSFTPVKGFFSGVGSMIEHMSGGGALRLLRHIEDPKEVEAVARFLKKNAAGGYALNMAGKEGLEAVKRGAGDVFAMAAKKGTTGVAWLRSGGSHVFRPHILLGATKGLYKGTIGKFADWVVRNYLDPGGKWLISGLCAWLVIECSMIHRRLKPKMTAALSPA